MFRANAHALTIITSPAQELPNVHTWATAAHHDLLAVEDIIRSIASQQDL
jgi:hypothetical protein